MVAQQLAYLTGNAADVFLGLPGNIADLRSCLLAKSSCLRTTLLCPGTPIDFSDACCTFLEFRNTLSCVLSGCLPEFRSKLCCLLSR